MERDLVDFTLLNEWICPHVAQQATSVNVHTERRAEAVNMMCRIAPLVGHEISVTCFLDAFVCLTTDVEFSIRKACALSYGQFCKVIGDHTVENVLLPKFFNLCIDSQWGVRKACADTFVDVSSVLLLEKRKPMLPNFYIGLLCDESRWVRFTAYQNLGRFIATFADPSKTGLQYNADGTWTYLEITSSQSLVSFSEIDDVDNYEPEVCDPSFETPFDGGPKYKRTEPSSAECALLEKDNEEDAISKSSPTLQFIDAGEEYAQDEMQQHCLDRQLLSDDCQTEKEQQSVLTGVDAQCNPLRVRLDESPVVQPVQSESSDSEVVSSDSPSAKSEISDSISDAKSPGVCSNNISSVEAREAISGHNEEPNSAIPLVLPHARTKSHSMSSATGSDFRYRRSSERSRSDSMSENPLMVTAKDGHVHLRLDSDNFFNNFQFWRTPLPEVELDVDIQDGRATSIHVRATAMDKSDNLCASDFSMKISPTLEPRGRSASEPLLNVKDLDALKMFVQTACVSKIFPSPSEDSVCVVQSSFDEASLTVVEGKIAELKQSHSDLTNDEGTDAHTLDETILMDSVASDSYQQSPYDQDIVPPELLEKFIEMVEPKLSMLLDSEITRYCAYCLPAVTYTVGRQNWACLRKMCELLASDMQWKVRKTIACCLHELATVLGCEISTKDLFPLFLTFLNDLDEVRMGLLQNLARFLKHITPKDRRKFLPYIANFLKMDNDRNWRFRYTLALQLIPTTKLFCFDDVQQYMIPIALVLIQDKVCDVRQAAIHLIAVIVWRVSQRQNTVVHLLEQLEEKLFYSDRWQWRQLYVMMCQRLLEENSISVQVFAEHFVSNLLVLAKDSVPNVRLAVARCFSESLTLDHIASIMNASSSLAAISALQQDEDKDVQYFAALGAGVFASKDLDMKVKNLTNLWQNMEEFKIDSK